VSDDVLIRLGDDAPLRRHGVVTIATGGDVSATMRPARLADRIISFVRGHDAIDELVRGLVRVLRTPPALDAVVMNPDIVSQIRRALDSARCPRVLLAGPDGLGRAMVVEAILGAAGRGHRGRGQDPGARRGGVARGSAARCLRDPRRWHRDRG
jgi:hypothetical protein